MWIASFVDASTTFLPSNTLISTFLSAAMITASASSISFAVRGSLAPPEPSFSTLNAIPSSLAFCSRDSAAINVCAIPVGHAVTATIFFVPEAAFERSVLFAFAASFSASFASRCARNSSTDFDSTRVLQNAGSISICISFERTSRCVSAPPSGAAIMNNKLLGLPSRAL